MRDKESRNMGVAVCGAERMEQCVLCGRVTDVPVSRPVAERTHYVDGAGELCSACFAKVYGVSELRWVSEPAAL